jgi:hypothetical protein
MFLALRLGAEILLLLSKMYRARIKEWVVVSLPDATKAFN